MLKYQLSRSNNLLTDSRLNYDLNIKIPFLHDYNDEEFDQEQYFHQVVHDFISYIIKLTDRKQKLTTVEIKHLEFLVDSFIVAKENLDNMG